MKTMCPPGYHHNGFVATHAFGHMNLQDIGDIKKHIGGSEKRLPSWNPITQYSMQNWKATARHEFTRKSRTKRLKHPDHLFKRTCS